MITLLLCRLLIWFTFLINFIDQKGEPKPLFRLFFTFFRSNQNCLILWPFRYWRIICLLLTDVSIKTYVKYVYGWASVSHAPNETHSMTLPFHADILWDCGYCTHHLIVFIDVFILCLYLPCPLDDVFYISPASPKKRGMLIRVGC